MKKGYLKDIIIILAIVIIAIVLCFGVKIETKEQYYLAHLDDIKEDSETVFLSIDCSSVFKNWDKLDDSLKDDKYIPEKGEISPNCRYVLRKGDTVFDILKRVTTAKKIQLEYQGADKNQLGGVYIQGINYLYEFSCGSASGWIYTVNGEFCNYSCDKYQPKNGDIIEWKYSCEIGEKYV